jgi:hypothetical protein
MKRIKYIIAVFAFFATTIFAVNAVEKITTLAYHYDYTTSCGTSHSINRNVPFTPQEKKDWEASKESSCLN